MDYIHKDLIVYANSILKNYDASHGIGHAMVVVKYVGKLYAEEEYDLPADYIHVAFVAGYVHDVVDKKYIRNVPEEKEKLKKKIAEYYGDIFAERVLKVVDCCSFTKRKIAKDKGEPMFTLEDSQLEFVAKLVTDADLIHSADPARCMMFTVKKNLPDEMAVWADMHRHIHTNLLNCYEYASTASGYKWTKKACEHLRDWWELNAPPNV